MGGSEKIMKGKPPPFSDALAALRVVVAARRPAAVSSGADAAIGSIRYVVYGVRGRHQVLIFGRRSRVKAKVSYEIWPLTSVVSQQGGKAVKRERIKTFWHLYRSLCAAFDAATAVRHC